MRWRWCKKAIYCVFGFLVLVAYLNDKRIQPDFDDILQTIEELYKKRSRLNKYLLQPHGKRRKRQTLFAGEA